jgi:hypothetical protein
MPSIPDFTSHAWQESVTNPQLRVSILDGKGTSMPEFRERISEQQAEDLISCVRAFSPVRAASAETLSSDFEARFREVQDHWNKIHREFQQLSKPRQETTTSPRPFTSLNTGS